MCFIAVLGKIYMKLHDKILTSWYAIALGAITGAAMSSIIHGYLIIAYEEKSLLYLQAGSIMGMAAGGFLGFISSALMSFYKVKFRVDDN